jgi:hypothetical protein
LNATFLWLRERSFEWRSTSFSPSGKKGIKANLY